MDMLRVCLPVLVTLLIGMLFREKKIISSEGVNALQALVMNVTLPIGLFSNFYKTNISLDTLIFPATFYIVTALGIFIGKFVIKFTKNKDPYLPFLFTGYEAGMLGYALLGILLGADKVTTFAMIDMGHGLAIFTIYTAMAKSVGGENQTPATMLKTIFTTPVLIGILVGILFGFSGVGAMIDASSFGPVLANLCSFLSAPTSVAILIVIGYRLKFKGIDYKSVGEAVTIRIVIQAVFAVAVIAIFKSLGGVFALPLTILSVVMMIILPPPYVLPLYAKGDKQKEFYSSAISFYTLLSIIGFVILAAVVLL